MKTDNSTTPRIFNTAFGAAVGVVFVGAAQAQTGFEGGYVGLGYGNLDGTVGGSASGNPIYDDDYLYGIGHGALNLFGGYNFVNGQTLYGVEATFWADALTSSDDYDTHGLKELYDLKFRVGRIFGDSLIYGSIGYTDSKANYYGSDAASSVYGDNSGLTFGGGFETNVTSRMFVGADVTMRNVDSLKVGPDLVTSVSARIGYRFSDHDGGGALSAETERGFDGFYAGFGYGAVDGTVGGDSGYDDDYLYGIGESAVNGFVGFNFVNGNMLYGAELTLWQDSLTYSDDYDTHGIRDMVDLKLRVGRVFGNSMFYGTIGRSTVLPNYYGSDSTYGDASGTLFGAGFETNLSDRVMVGIDFTSRGVNDLKVGPDRINTTSIRAGVRF